MAKFDPKKAAAHLQFAPRVVRISSPTKIAFLFDSQLQEDQHRSLRHLRIDPSAAEAFAIEVKYLTKSKGIFEIRTITAAVSQEPEDADGGATVATIKLDLCAPPFHDGPLSDEQIEALGHCVALKLRNTLLPAFADALLAGPQDVVVDAPAATSEQLRLVPAGKVRSASQSARTGGALRFAKPALAVAVLLLLGYGALGLLQERTAGEQYMASIDPIIRQQLKAAGLQGANNPAAVPNITEQTLKAMGLDPGQATSLSCLGQ